MAIMQHDLIFGDVHSSDYGLYISGEGVFDAPKRDVEMISIPGRNGAFALDKGRFENITVTYPAFNHESDLETFTQNLDAFRNAICAQGGYQRLTDSFHPDEYRMATYISGLEVKPVKYNTAAEFDIVFDCQPQRFLMSGEAPITVSSGDTILNPTLFEAKPMLEVKGYGDITIGDKTVSLANILIGNIRVGSAFGSNNSSYRVRIDTSNLNTGDTISLSSFIGELGYTRKSSYIIDALSVGSTTNCTATITSTKRTIRMEPQTFTLGTPKNVSASATFSIAYTYNGSAGTATPTNTIVVSYDGDKTFRFSLSSSTPGAPFSYHGYRLTNSSIYADSTKSALGNPTYVDLDIGAAWNADNGTAVSLNNAVILPAALPGLFPGNTAITFDNTITELKIIPRWWKI